MERFELRSMSVMEERRFIKQKITTNLYYVYRGIMYQENIEYFQKKGLFISAVETKNEDVPFHYLIKTPHLKEVWRKRRAQTNHLNQVKDEVSMLSFLAFLLFLVNQFLH